VYAKTERLYTYRWFVGQADQRMVICLTMSAFVEEPAPEMLPALPAFFSNTFQNFKLSSAAAVASIWPSGLRELCKTRLSWAGISTLRTSVG
jgi:hypothetical protein